MEQRPLAFSDEKNLYVPDWWFDLTGLKSRQKLGLLELMRKADRETRIAQVTYKYLAKKLMCSERTAIRVMQRLAEAGQIEIIKTRNENGLNDANHYRIL